ncbi:Protein of unknown function [Kosakonia arachidis]|uniref:DUF2946 domain-containing protein n=1 Tax=Kosakonia arachidis TaxID=551989 RepID=A0A1I7E5Z1_9ENTR|nr:Protein of unknown function [Kosakonia arachidis]
MKNVFHQWAAKRSATWLALSAILLIVIAPLISISLQRDPMSAMPGMHHEMPMHHEMSSQPETHLQTSLPVDHAEACGYCVLLAHVPGLILLVALLLMGRALRIRLIPARPLVRLWHFFPWLCPDTRAPPLFCFS